MTDCNQTVCKDCVRHQNDKLELRRILFSKVTHVEVANDPAHVHMRVHIEDPHNFYKLKPHVKVIFLLCGLADFMHFFETHSEATWSGLETLHDKGIDSWCAWYEKNIRPRLK